MSEIATTYEEVSKLHPAAVQQVMDKLRSGKSKEKNAKPEDLKWVYSWGTWIEGSGSAAEVFSAAGRAKALARQQAESAMTAEERAADEFRRTTMNLHGKIGRWWGSSDTISPFIPQKVKDMITERHKKSIADKARHDAMPEDQKQAEIQALLTKLHGFGGFVAL